MEQPQLSQLDITDVMRFMKPFTQASDRDKFKEYNTLTSYIDGLNIKVKYEGKTSETGQKEIRRVILSPDRKNNNPKSKLGYQANGIILDSDTWKVVSMPPERFALHPKKESIINRLSEYEIYEINDGTTITLYWWGDKWCISTSNGFENNDYKWVGQTTYSEVFDEVASKYPEFSFDKLDKNCSYSIGFRSHRFHPLKADGESAWFIRCFDVSSMKDVTETVEIGIPKQKKANIPAVNSGEELFKYISETNEKAYKNFTNVSAVHYGFILRSKDSDAIDNRNICMESTLLKTIRQLMYNIPKRGDRHHSREVVAALNSETTTVYCSLRAFLNRRSDFVKLFPELESLYTSHGNLIAQLTKKIASRLASNRKSGANKQYKTKTSGKSEVKSPEKPLTVENAENVKEKSQSLTIQVQESEINHIINELTGYVKRDRFAASSQFAESVISDVITVPLLLDVYFMLYVRSMVAKK